MSAENRLHFFRMAAWDMFDPDQLPKRERKIRLRQIRQVFDECGFHLECGIAGDSRGETYPIYTLTTKDVLPSETFMASYGTLRKIGPHCAKVLNVVNKKFPPTPTE